MPSQYARRAIWAVVAAAVLAAVVTSVWWVDGLRRAEREANAGTGGSASRALPILLANGCSGCHTIQGVPGAQGMVGPRLDAAVSKKTLVGGVLPNTPKNMVQWLRASRQVDPRTAMPSTGISEQEARDVAAYLYALR